ncbi:DUF928 domain-containing protein [Microcoleus sp. Pol7_A1]|uniref:DUF928 domain-containing protein n=1 Tax=Microcoleus sp. Pol7_A1 TaxID=2818893 RepID=UPI002FCFBC81
MKKTTKFIINLTSVASIVLIATLNASPLAVVGQPTPNNVDGGPPTRSGGPRFIQPTEDPLTPSNPGPPRSSPGPTRRASQCVKGKIKLTALVPPNKIGRTVSEYPLFFFYLPQTDAPLAEFVLQDENGKQIYQTTLKINNSSGVIGVSIPANQNVSPLEAGKNYRWSVALICETEDRSADVSETGIVRRVELSADIRSQLEKADPRQKTVIYAQNGIWQDALSTLAAARRANPNDAELAADWESLLDSVTLGGIAKEPIVEIEQQP